MLLPNRRHHFLGLNTNLLLALHYTFIHSFYVVLLLLFFTIPTTSQFIHCIISFIHCTLLSFIMLRLPFPLSYFYSLRHTFLIGVFIYYSLHHSITLHHTPISTPYFHSSQHSFTTPYHHLLQHTFINCTIYLFPTPYFHSLHHTSIHNAILLSPHCIFIHYTIPLFTTPHLAATKCLPRHAL